MMSTASATASGIGHGVAKDRHTVGSRSFRTNRGSPALPGTRGDVIVLGLPDDDLENIADHVAEAGLHRTVAILHPQSLPGGPPG